MSTKNTALVCGVGFSKQGETGGVVRSDSRTTKDTGPATKFERPQSKS